MSIQLGPQLKPVSGSIEALPAGRLDRAIAHGIDYLMSLQSTEGYWLAELGADSTLVSDYVFYLHVLGRLDPGRVAKMAEHIRRAQLANGGWNIFYDGPAEVNATVKAYFALRIAGDAPQSAHLVRAREQVRKLGGLERTNSFTRLYLALAGVIGWDMVPAIPPELMLLPGWFPINIYEMSSWTRAIVIPLTILYGRKPRWSVDPAVSVDELFLDSAKRTAAFDLEAKISWRNAFLLLDRTLKLYERMPWKPGRRFALRLAEEWMLQHLDRSDGLAAIYPAMMNSVFALLASGYPSGQPVTEKQIAEMARFEIEEPDTLRLQPCLSPLWDTAIALFTLQEAGVATEDPRLRRTVDWLLDRQILGPGDWQVKNKDAAPGGWAFEFRNDFYPDVDDTAFVLMALQHASCPEGQRLASAIRQGVNWMVSMQNRDGGWAAFDRDNDRALLNQIPFADHNAMLDPSSPDLTARVLECLGRYGWTTANPRIQRAVDYLRRNQTVEGAWFGRWGANYIYGTSGVLRALAAVNVRNTMTDRAIRWLCSVQHADGSFGETCESYDDPRLIGQGEGTASQTAWALIGLLAFLPASDPAVERGIRYLLDRQSDTGTWEEKHFTGTGFPKVFYLRYGLYPHYFPLHALVRFRQKLQNHEEAS